MLNSKKTSYLISEKQQLTAALQDLTMEAEETTTALFNKPCLKELLSSKLNNPKKCIKIPGRYSNATYQINDLVLRFPKLTNPLVRNLSIEVNNLKQARDVNLCPLEPVAYYSKHNLLVTCFITHYRLVTLDDLKSREKIKAVAKLVKKLHYYSGQFKKNPETPFSFVDAKSKSFVNIQKILNEQDKPILEKITKIRNILAKFNVIERPSHGDLHHSNLIETGGTMQLIDWEVSSLEDPAYDIARLFCVSDFNEENRKIFLDSYQRSGKITLDENEIRSLKQRIQLFEPINYFSIVLWAKFELQFNEGDKKKELEKAIHIYSKKTSKALDSLNLDEKNFSLVSHTTFFQPLKLSKQILRLKLLH